MEEPEKQLYLQAVRAAKELRDNLDALIGMATAEGRQDSVDHVGIMQEAHDEARYIHHYLSEFLGL